MSTVSIGVSGLSLGAHSANEFTGFTSPATSVSTGGDGLKYLAPNPNPASDKLVCTTTGSSRDQELTTYTAKGGYFLRCDGTSAIYMYWQSGSVQIGIVTPFDPADGTGDLDVLGGAGKTYSTYVTLDPGTDLAGFSGLDGTDTVTLGCSGFDVYLKFNGVEVVRFQQWQHMASGKMSLWPQAGCRDVTAEFLATAELYSDPDNKTFDPRDTGMRDFPACTGSITGGTNTLVLSSNPGFVVGDTVIVEIGGESGEGLRGAEGVGGHWPSTAGGFDYADAATMNADSSKPTGTWAATLDDGFVYAYNGAAWVRSSGHGDGAYLLQGYYSCFMNPQSLVSVVTNVSGTTLTLTDNAVTTATNANVYLDSRPAMQVFFKTPTGNPGLENIPTNLPDRDYDGMIFNLPSGNYYFSTAQVIGVTGTMTWPNLTLTGANDATVLHCPKGCQGWQVTVAHSDGVTFGHFKVLGNHGRDGFFYNITAGNSGTEAPSGQTALSNCDDSVIEYVNTYDVMKAAQSTEAGTDTWIRRCTLTQNYPQEQYTQWGIAMSNATRGGIADCTFYSPTYMWKGFECFACDGAQFLRNTSTNGQWSTNSSSFTWENCYATIKANSIYTAVLTPPQDPIFNVNCNAFGTPAGGSECVIHDCTIIQEGLADGTSSFPFIQIQESYDNRAVTISGSYPQCPPGKAYGGYFEAPDYVSGSAYGPTIISDADGTIVSGIRISGAAIGSPGHSNHYGNISLLHHSVTDPVNCVIENCIADVIQPGASEAGNMTNAEYSTYCSGLTPTKGFR